MSKKKKIAIIVGAVVAFVLIAALTLGLTLPHVQFARKNDPLFEKAREILLDNFAATQYGEKTRLKRVIDSRNPLNLVNYYGDEPLADLWASIPATQKPYTVILLIPGQILNPGSENSLNNLERWADECEAGAIPYAIQNVNGETHMEARPPVAYLESRFAAKHRYFYGLNAAELYNGVEWRGDSESDQSFYIVQLIKMCAKYGAYFIWTDTNRNYENGMLLHWLENNESFYSAFRNYAEYICLLNKESIAHPSTYAVMEGLWLAGLVGNWGVASDWWHWQCDGDKKSLFGENDAYVDDEWEMIFSFHENMYVQSMMLGMSRGATCFKAEAPNFSTSYGGKPLAGFEYGISPLFERILSGSIVIPTKADVFAATNFAVLGKQNYSKANYDFAESNLYPKNGASGIVPLLPSNLRLEERKAFLEKGIELIDVPLTDEAFSERYGANDADTYLTNIATDWFFIHNSENERKIKTARFQPNYASAESVSIEAEEHTSAIVSEKKYGLDFYVSNYRTDKTDMYRVGTPQQRQELGWARYVSLYLGLDENGDPLGADDSERRKTTVTVKGTYGGGSPEVVFRNARDGSGPNNRPFSYEERYDAESETYTLEILHNGILDFTIRLDDAEVDYAPTFRAAIAETRSVNSALSLNALSEATAEKITDDWNYTYFSYLEYDKAFEKARAAISERTCSQSEADEILAELTNAKNALIAVGEIAELCRDVLTEKDRKEAVDQALDALIRELCSSKKYVEGRSNLLVYAKFYKNTNIRDEIAKKPKYLEKRFDALKDRIETA